MKTLGIYWGMCSTAALFKDNALVSAVSEERFSRKKNDESFPRRSIEWCLKHHNIKSSDLDGVFVASIYQPAEDILLQKYSNWSIQDYVREQKDYWKPVLLEKAEVNKFHVFKDKIKTDIYPSRYWESVAADPEKAKYHEDRLEIVAQALEIPRDKVKALEHHRCHAAYSYYASELDKSKPTLSLTLDGFGDGLNATVNIVHPSGRIERIHGTNQCFIGRVYRYVTLILGMKPNEHEYKVMGLAPYAKPSIARGPYELFKNTLYVDGLDFKWKVRPTDSYFWFKDKLEGYRFDGIAAGMQMWVEELVCQWVRNAIEKTNVHQVVISGGVSMNVKAMGKVAQMPEVESFFVGGSGSDESLALAAAIVGAHDLSEKWNPKDIKPLTSLYLGPDSTEAQESDVVKVALEKGFVASKWEARDIASRLVSGQVLATCWGRMEFGQRALGNRSILSDPSQLQAVPKINETIKNRDFWMPFAPVVKDTFAAKYLINPKSYPSPHMTLGFDTTDLGYKDMPAGCHQGDRSARAEILTEKINPRLYKVLEEFEALTGRGALINTSFNLHGFPIVNTPMEAFEVLEKSKLDGIILNNYLISR